MSPDYRKRGCTGSARCSLFVPFLSLIRPDFPATYEHIANLEYYLYSYDSSGKSKNTNYDVDLPSGFTASNTMIVAIGYQLGGDTYPAYYLGGLDADIKMAIRIISTNKIRFSFIGTYSTNGTLKILLAKYPTT